MPAKKDSLDLRLPGAIIEHGQAIAAAHTGIRQRNAAPAAERMDEIEDRLLGMVKGSAMARRLTGIQTAGQGDSERRIRLRVFALLGFRAIAQPSSQPVSEISDVAAAVLDRRLPPGEGLLNARQIIGEMAVKDLVIACGGSESGPCTKIVLAGHAVEWLNGGKSSLGYLTVAKMIGVSLPDENESKDRGNPKEFVTNLLRGFTSLTPRMLYDKLERRGYVGQDEARRRMCLAAYRHVMRLRRVCVDGAPGEHLPRENILLHGPTGSGKSLLASTLFKDILGLPCIVADMTTFTESGYVGEDVASILTRLVCSFGTAIGELAVVVMEEIDKIGDPAGMDGGRSMVSRHGVQRSLLRLLEPGTIDVPAELGVPPYRSRRVNFSTQNLLWIGCGAFTGLARARCQRNPLGFGSSIEDKDERETVGASDMSTHGGIMPELYGRFGLEIQLAQLSRSQCRAILDRTVIERYGKELAAAGIALLVEPSARDLLVDRALARGTGARGLQAEMISSIQDAAFDAYSDAGTDRLVRLYAQNGAVRWEIGRRPPSAKVSMVEIAALVEAPPLDMADAVS